MYSYIRTHTDAIQLKCHAYKRLLILILTFVYRVYVVSHLLLCVYVILFFCLPTTFAFYIQLTEFCFFFCLNLLSFFPFSVVSFLLLLYIANDIETPLKSKSHKQFLMYSDCIKIQSNQSKKAIENEFLDCTSL